MADRMPGEIFIGGQVSRDLLPDFLAALSAQFITLDWGDTRFCPQTAEDLLDNCEDHQGTIVLRLCHDEARYGVFETLETFLRDHDIPFDRYTDGRYEFDPLWTYFRPGQALREFTTDTDRKRQFGESLLVKLAEQLDLALGHFAAQEMALGISTVEDAHRQLQEELATGWEALPPFQLVSAVPAGQIDDSPISPSQE